VQRDILESAPRPLGCYFEARYSLRHLLQRWLVADQASAEGLLIAAKASAYPDLVVPMYRRPCDAALGSLFEARYSFEPLLH
jgi:hypothetical protein